MGGACSTNWKNTYKILVGKPRRRWEESFRIDLREIR